VTWKKTMDVTRKWKKLWMKFWWIWNGFYFDITYVALMAARQWQQPYFSHGNRMMENGWPSPWLRQWPLDGQSWMMGRWRIKYEQLDSLPPLGQLCTRVHSRGRYWPQ
jgi:hypothetical protein